MVRKNDPARQFYRESSVFGRNSDRYDRIYHSFQNPSHRCEDMVRCWSQNFALVQFRTMGGWGTRGLPCASSSTYLLTYLVAGYLAIYIVLFSRDVYIHP